jgi:hypothetical protein
MQERRFLRRRRVAEGALRQVRHGNTFLALQIESAARTLTDLLRAGVDHGWARVYRQASNHTVPLRLSTQPKSKSTTTSKYKSGVA